MLSLQYCHEPFVWTITVLTSSNGVDHRPISRYHSSDIRSQLYTQSSRWNVKEVNCAELDSNALKLQPVQALAMVS